MVLTDSKDTKLLLMSVFAAIFVTGTLINDGGNNTENRHSKSIKSDLLNFLETDSKMAVSHNLDFFPVDTTAKIPPNFCHCDASALTLILAPLKGPEPQIKIVHNAAAQTIPVIDANVADCGLADFIYLCGPLEFLFKDATTLE